MKNSQASLAILDIVGRANSLMLILRRNQKFSSFLNSIYQSLPQDEVSFADKFTLGYTSTLNRAQNLEASTRAALQAKLLPLRANLQDDTSKKILDCFTIKFDSKKDAEGNTRHYIRILFDVKEAIKKIHGLTDADVGKIFSSSSPGEQHKLTCFANLPADYYGVLKSDQHMKIDGNPSITKFHRVEYQYLEISGKNEFSPTVAKKNPKTMKARGIARQIPFCVDSPTTSTEVSPVQNRDSSNSKANRLHDLNGNLGSPDAVDPSIKRSRTLNSSLASTASASNSDVDEQSGPSRSELAMPPAALVGFVSAAELERFQQQQTIAVESVPISRSDSNLASTRAEVRPMGDIPVDLTRSGSQMRLEQSARPTTNELGSAANPIIINPPGPSTMKQIPISDFFRPKHDHVKEAGPVVNVGHKI